MAMYYKNRREDKERAAIDRDQTAAALRAIEKAAKAAYSKDVANFAGTSGIYLSDREREAHRLSTLAPPPAPALPSRRRPAPPPKEDDSAEQKPTKLEQPFLGQYTVDGKVYLEGEHFEMKIARNMACELWNETADDWVPAVVVSVAEVSIPNTNRTFRQYKVKFQPDESSTNIADALTATVRADALRLVPALPPPVEKRDQLREEAAKIEVASDTAGGTRKVDKHTGYGQWSTVTLSVEQTQEQDHQRRVAATSVFKQSFVRIRSSCATLCSLSLTLTCVAGQKAKTQCPTFRSPGCRGNYGCLCAVQSTWRSVPWCRCRRGSGDARRNEKRGIRHCGSACSYVQEEKKDGRQEKEIQDEKIFKFR